MAVEKQQRVPIVVIGSGLAGMSAALSCAEEGRRVFLVSHLAAERAQSVMAEGGINAALDTKGEGDDPDQHAADTLRSAAGLACEQAVRGLAIAAPRIVRQLHAAGVQFNVDERGEIDLRPFGGQKKRRTAFAKDDTGKQLVTALIDMVRRYEEEGLIVRFDHHEFVRLLFRTGPGRRCSGCVVRDLYKDREVSLAAGGVIIATGGVHGLFADTTGSLANTGEVTAALFYMGLPVANGEMIQYHPTTAEGNGKRMLLTEAARGEGGRLFAWRDAGTVREKWYFMEEKYPELGNLMPRDVTAREIWRVIHADSEKGKEQERPVYLDLTDLPPKVLEGKLSGLAADCQKYLGLDPAQTPIPVSPGIHYFMGGLLVDEQHHTPLAGLYAAGECCAQYHGANRLGGNSLLGAIYGGHVAAKTACMESGDVSMETELEESPGEGLPAYADREQPKRYRALCGEMRDLLQEALGVVRSGTALEVALTAWRNFSPQSGRGKVFLGTALQPRYAGRYFLGEALLMSALAREESRGGHYRSDFPERNDERFALCSVARYVDGEVNISFEDPR